MERGWRVESSGTFAVLSDAGTVRSDVLTVSDFFVSNYFYNYDIL